MSGGGDTELSHARKVMDTNLSRLQNATELSMLSNTVELQQMSVELESNQQSHQQMLKEQKGTMDIILQDTESIRADMAKLLKSFEEQREQRGERKAKPYQPAANQSLSVNCVRGWMPITVVVDSHEHCVLRDTLVPGTCMWLYSQPAWKDWFKEQDGEVRPMLAVTGEPGIGKSHLAASIYEKLRAEEALTDASLRTCVARFYFHGQSRDLEDEFLQCLVSVIMQIAEQSAPICEDMCAEIIRDENEYYFEDTEDLSERVLGPMFAATSKNRLWLVLDGLDELDDDARELLTEFAEYVQDQRLRINIITTTRPEVLSNLCEDLRVDRIEANKDLQLQDLKTLIWYRM